MPLTKTGRELIEKFERAVEAYTDGFWGGCEPEKSEYEIARKELEDYLEACEKDSGRSYQEQWLRMQKSD